MDRGDVLLDLDITRFLPCVLDRAESALLKSLGSAFQSHGIDIQSWRVLAVLHGGTGKRIGVIADLTGIEISTLSRLIGRMEAAGLIERRRGTEDLRSIFVDLTYKGEALTGALIPVAHACEAKALAGFSEAEIHQLRDLLSRLAENLLDTGLEMPEATA